MPLDPKTRAQIQQLCDNLQIPLYIRADGRVCQHPPGEQLLPDPKAGPNLNHGAPMRQPEPEPENG